MPPKTKRILTGPISYDSTEARLSYLESLVNKKQQQELIDESYHEGKIAGWTKGWDAALFPALLLGAIFGAGAVLLIWKIRTYTTGSSSAFRR